MRENQTKDQVITQGIISSYEETDLWEIKWVWEETQKKLFENWIYNQEQLLQREDVESLDLPFFSKNAIKKFLESNKK